MKKYSLYLILFFTFLFLYFGIDLVYCYLIKKDSILSEEIILKSDGTNIDFNVEPCQSFISGEQLEEDQENYQFICNKNSKKIHRPDCSGVQMMKEENKLYTNESKEDLIKRGYNPCQMCDP